MSPLLKNIVKTVSRQVVYALPPNIFRMFISSLSPRLLRIFDGPKFTNKYPIQPNPPYELWEISTSPEGHMVVEGCDVVFLAERYGTPLYVVDGKRLERNYFSFLRSFLDRYPDVEVAYSYKTNPLPGAIKLLHECGAGAEVVSPYELRLALELGVSPENIIYNGPGKTEDGLNMAVSNRIKLINVDSIDEFEIIDALAGRTGHKQQVGIRVITSVGWGRKFGFPIDSGAAYEAFRRVREFQNLIPCAINFHLGTGIKSPNSYVKAIKEVLDLSKPLRDELGITLRYFDLGGGFDICPTVRSYSAVDKKLSEKHFPVQEPVVQPHTELADYGKAICEPFRKYLPSFKSTPTIILEPGRAITSSAQFLLVKVLVVKPSINGISDVILDGGRNVASPLGWECHTIFNASKMDAPMDCYYGLFGPLCTPYDVICNVKKLSRLESGDILAVMDTGAYFISMLSNFCQFPKPAAVLITEGRHELIRRRQSFEDMMLQDSELLS